MMVDLNKTISYEVSKVEVLWTTIQVQNGVLSFLVSYRWLAADGSVLRFSTVRYTQAQLVEALGGGDQATALMTSITSLFTDGPRPGIGLRTPNSGTPIVTAYNQETVDGKQTVKRYTDAELEEHGVSANAIAAAIRQLAQVLS